MRLKRSGSRRRSRAPLPSLFDRHPDALRASRHARGIREVPVEAIVGTARHPTQNTADFLPLSSLRGRNWEARWQRIRTATEQMTVLPPVDLLRVGDEYWVVDGHNRIAAALQVGVVAVDADVTELLVPGVASGPHDASIGSTQVVSDQLRQAVEGRLTRGAGYRTPELPREELAATVEQASERATSEEEDDEEEGEP
jgi:hypothetical protein